VPDTALTRGQAEFVERQRVAALATIFADGRPHVVPVSTVLDVNRLVFATELDTQKVHNLKGDPHVALAFDEYSEDWAELRQVVVFGRAMVIESGPEFERGRGLLYEKFEQYEPIAPIVQGRAAIVEIRIDRVSADGVP
jgi:nitroimidazol reductase NimA-like FMN-containing flavoprotein (pyridoxamine 5'-phosphate oxidase superfamily)